MPPPRMTFGAFLAEAFKNRWNLLVLGASSAAGVISGHPGVVLPLVAAAELGAVVWLATNPRFQRAVVAQKGAVESSRTNQQLQARFDELYRGLDAPSKRKFDELAGQCESLRILAQRAASGTETGFEHLTEEQLKGVNKLLWVYLKLLHTRTTLDRFFQNTNERELEQQVAATEHKLKAMPEVTDDAIEARKRKTVEDTLASLKGRMENVKRARANYEFVGLELERVSTKLMGLAEMAVNRADPSTVTSQVDDAAHTVEATEQTLSELQAITGISSDDVEAPQILSAQRVRV